MPSVCLYFQVHQPFRIKKYSYFGIGQDHEYFGDESKTSLDNRYILERVARKCYLPTNQVILELLERHPEFRAAYSLSGVILEQLEAYLPDVLESFRALVRTGRVEILGETYHHSLAFLHSRDEFRRQVALHMYKVKQVFGVRPQIFRNTELIYSNDVAREVEDLGFRGILAEGADKLLGWRSPDFVYRPASAKNLGLLLKNYRLSDDIAFRFSSRQWKDWPLTADKFAKWVSEVNGNGTNVNLFMDYETFGEHQWTETGIFEFLRHMPAEILKRPDNDFATPSEVIDRYQPIGEIDVPDFVSWADIDRDLSAWQGNPLQDSALRSLYELEKPVFESGDPLLIDDWSKLQTSDHFYYMCTKWFADGDVHAYFNPYETPYDAFATYMNVIQDLKRRIATSRGGERV
jgi:alpha-amylase